MPQRTKTLLLVVFLLALGVGILWTGAVELSGVEQAVDRRAAFVSVGRGPVYGVVAGVALLLLGGVIAAVDILHLPAGKTLVRAIGIGLAGAVLALALLPFVYSQMTEQRLQVAGYNRCETSGRGRWTSSRWAAPGRRCAEPPAVRADGP